MPASSETKTKFQARTTVRDEVVDSAVVEIYNQLKKMSNIPITDEELENAKSGYFGSFAMSMENPVTIANQALNIRTENLPENFYSTFLENINKVSKVTWDQVKVIAEDKICLLYTSPSQRD